MANVIIFEGSSKRVRIPGSTENFTLRIVVDNGNDSIANQSWRATHFVSAEVTSGTYTLRWPPENNKNFSVQTDADGNVIQAACGGFSNGADTFAESAATGNGGHIAAASNNTFIRDTQMRENIHSDATDHSLRGRDENCTGWSVEQPVTVNAGGDLDIFALGYSIKIFFKALLGLG